LILSQYAGDLLYDAVEIELTFYFAPPKSTPKKKLPLFLKNVLHVSTRPDCTNCQKLFEDCLQGTVIANDRQVQKISSQKQWAAQAYITCIIKKISYQSVGDEKK
jgi:Holliday junction resolvase RusA-like endonuclease